MGTGFHSGELLVQRRAGLRAEADRNGAIVRDLVAPAAAGFLAERFMLVIGAQEAQEHGNTWCSLLTGPPGFLHAENIGGAGYRARVDVAARPLPTDPLAGALAGRVEVGALAIDPSTRRRMRINGVSEPTPRGLRIEVRQAYGNCPKYIQRRDPELTAVAAGQPVIGTALSEPDREIIERADTFFIATAAADGAADASHRGGNPGFVRILGDGTEAGDTELSWLDYKGNARMMTLGNLSQNPACGLLFLDWRTGTTLQLSGQARIEWHGTDRELQFRLRELRRTEGAGPRDTHEPEYSRFNP
jgi:hypothetical protein